MKTSNRTGLNLQNDQWYDLGNRLEMYTYKLIAKAMLIINHCHTFRTGYVAITEQPSSRFSDRFVYVCLPIYLFGVDNFPTHDNFQICLLYTSRCV